MLISHLPEPKMRFFWWVLLLWFGLVACTSQEVTPITSPTEVVDGNQMVNVTVYFTDSNRYAIGDDPYEVGVTRQAFASQFHPEVVLEEFFIGPTLEEQAQGLIAVISGATGFSSLVVGDGVAHVYLEGECNSGGATYTIAQPLAVNLKQFDVIDTIKIYDENGETEVPDGQSDSIPFCLEP